MLTLKSLPRVLTGRRTRINTTQGDNVYHQGRTTGYSYGYVAQINYAPTYDNACNGQTCSPVWVRVKGTSASGTGSGQCNEYYYMSTDELYNLGFSLVY